MCSSVMLSNTGTSARRGRTRLPRASDSPTSARAPIAERMADIHKGGSVSRSTLFTGHVTPQASTTVMSMIAPRRRDPSAAVGEGAIEGLGEIRDEVVGILDADRVPDQVVLDPDLEALLAGELVEAHDGGLLDEAFHAAQRRRDVRDGARIHDPRGGIEVPTDLEGDDAPEAPHLLARDVVLGVRGQPRVVDGGDARMPREELRHRLRVRVLALHAQREGLEPAHEQI